MMINYVLLYLFVAVIALSHGHYISEPISEIRLDRSNRLPRETSEIAPDILDKQFVLALSVINDQGLPGLSVQIIEPFNKTKSKCFVPFTLALNSSAHPIRRLSHRVVLLSVKEEPKYNSSQVEEDEEEEEDVNVEKGEVKLVILNTNNCKYSDVYNSTLPASHYIFPNEDKSNERFTVLVYGKEFCRGHKWCRLFFDPLYRKFESIDFDFNWKKYVDIQLATTFDGNQFVVRYMEDNYDDSDDEDDSKKEHKYWIRLYDISNEWNDIKHIELYHTDTNNKRLSDEDYAWWRNPWPTRYYYYDVHDNVRSSGLSYCWTVGGQRFSKYIECKSHRTNGSVLFATGALQFKEEMRLLQVINIPNGLVVFTRVMDCDATSWKFWSECQEVRITVIKCRFAKCVVPIVAPRFQLKFMRGQYDFECQNVDGLKVRVNETNNNLIRVEYLCNHFMTMSYHVLDLNLMALDRV